MTCITILKKIYLIRILRKTNILSIDLQNTHVQQA
jgi:hypothetical protein